MGIHDSLLVELFDVDDTESLILKSGLEVTQGHTNWCHSKAWVQFPIVTMAVICGKLGNGKVGNGKLGNRKIRQR